MMPCEIMQITFHTMIMMPCVIMLSTFHTVVMMTCEIMLSTFHTVIMIDIMQIELTKNCIITVFAVLIFPIKDYTTLDTTFARLSTLFTSNWAVLSASGHSNTTFQYSNRYCELGNRCWGHCAHVTIINLQTCKTVIILYCTTN